jgi:hypothetical protein
MIVNRKLLLASAMLLPLLAAGAASAATHKKPVHITHKVVAHKMAHARVAKPHHARLSAVKTHHAIKQTKHAQS